MSGHGAEILRSVGAAGICRLCVACAMIGCIVPFISTFTLCELEPILVAADTLCEATAQKKETNTTES